MTRALSRRERSERFTEWRWIARRQRKRILGAHDRWIQLARGRRFVPFSTAMRGDILYVDRATGRCGTAADVLMPAAFAQFGKAFRRFAKGLTGMAKSFDAWFSGPRPPMPGAP